MELHNVALFGVLFIIKITWVYGSCGVNACVTSTSFFLTCKEYTSTMSCMTMKYNTCTGKADTSDTFLSMQAAQTPSDCQLDMTQMASSMTARSEMLTAMMKKSDGGGMFPWGTVNTGTDGTVPSIPPIAMMGDDFGEMDDGPFDDGPFDDGPFDDGPFDDDGMMGAAMMPGLFGLGSHTEAPPPAPGVQPAVTNQQQRGGGVRRRGGAARQVDNRDTDTNTADRVTVTSLVLILLPLFVYLDLYTV